MQEIAKDLRSNVEGLERVNDLSQLEDQRQTLETTNRIIREAVMTEANLTVVAHGRARNVGSSNSEVSQASRRTPDSPLPSEPAEVEGDVPEHFHQLKDRLVYAGFWLLFCKQWVYWTGKEPERPILWIRGRYAAQPSLIAHTVQRLREVAPNTCLVVQQLTKGLRCLSRDTVLGQLRSQLYKHAQEQGLVRDSEARTITTGRESKVAILALLDRIPTTCVMLSGIDESAGPGVLEYIEFLATLAKRNHGRIRLWCTSEGPVAALDRVQAVGRTLMAEVVIDLAGPGLLVHGAEEAPEPNQPTGVICYVPTLPDKNWQLPLLTISSPQSKIEEREWAQKLSEIMDHGVQISANASLHESPNTSDPSSYELRRQTLQAKVRSILTFARRSLLLREIQEAITLTTVRLCHDLSSVEMIPKDLIFDACGSFVTVYGHVDDDEEAVILLSDACAHDSFSMKSRAASVEDPWGTGIISEDKLRDCCIGYLLQGCLSRPFNRNAQGRFVNDRGDDIDSFRFLAYASENWALHCANEMRTSHGQHLMKTLLQAPNVMTCLQVQHQFLGPDTVESMHEALSKLPAEMRSLRLDAADFLVEWDHVLRMDPKAGDYGQVDRCFWKLFDKQDFASHCKGRYESFQIGSHDADDETFLDTNVSADGAELTTCKLLPTRVGEPRLCIEQWQLDTLRGRHMLQCKTVTLSKADVEWHWYCGPSRQVLPLVPTVSKPLATPKQTIASCGPKGEYLRVGVAILTSLDLRDTDVIDTIGAVCRSYAEEVAVRGRCIAMARRRRPLPDTAKSRTKEELRTWRLRRKLEERPRAQSLPSSPPSSRERDMHGRLPRAQPREPRAVRQRGLAMPHPRERHSRVLPPWAPRATGIPIVTEGAKPVSSRQTGRMNNVGVQRSQRAYATHGDPGEAASLPSDSESLQSPPTASDPASLNDSDEILAEDDDSEGASEDVSLADPDDASGTGTSSMSHGEHELLSNTTTSDESSDDRSLRSYAGSSSSSDFGDLDELISAEDTSASPKNEETYNPASPNIFCDVCDQTVLHHYHCLACNDGNFDICQDCFEDGRWCLDKVHELTYREGYTEKSIHTWARFEFDHR